MTPDRIQALAEREWGLPWYWLSGAAIGDNPIPECLKAPVVPEEIRDVVKRLEQEN